MSFGSGMVEGAAKQYKAHFYGPGMRWSRKGAERLLPIRTAIMSRRFDKMWYLAYNSPPIRNAPETRLAIEIDLD